MNIQTLRDNLVKEKTGLEDAQRNLVEALENLRKADIEISFARAKVEGHFTAIVNLSERLITAHEDSD